MDTSFIMLGSGAVRNNQRRGGPAQALKIDNRVLMFDCGRYSCTNLARVGIKVETIDRLFLTHLHFDHIIPFSKGGSSLVAENIQLLCVRHNIAKRDRIE